MGKADAGNNRTNSTVGNRKNGRTATESAELKKLDRELKQTRKQLKKYTRLYREAQEENEQLRAECDRLLQQYNCISKSEMWKITKPFRLMLDAVKKIPPLRLAGKFVKNLKQSGWRATMVKVRSHGNAQKQIRKKMRKAAFHEISRKQRLLEEETVFDREVLFSILVPLYNTPIAFLNEMISSVYTQTYPSWELCLADGSDAEHGDVEKEVQKWMKKDSRIKYRKLEKNLGISENTNACIDMATGNFIALFDHDDVLHPSALYEMMQVICRENADYVYTDEATFESPDIRKIITCHYKPDYAIDTLRGNNYICHFSAFSREVLEKAGRFRSAYDGSQDHDMILRLTAVASHVVHIPKLLYFWRSHPQSVAMDISSKTYAIDAGKRAVREDVRAHGYDAVVESTRAFPTIYRIRYALKAEAPEKVSLLILSKNNVKILRKCLQSILEKTTYPNYEIIIVDNASDEPKLLQYYKELQKDKHIRILHYDEPFNYSAMNNLAAETATGKYLVLLNNDIEIITPEWLEEMMMFAQREDVGAVGAMLYYPDNSIQHAGVILGLGADRIAGHPFYRFPRESIGYMGRLCYAQNMSAVTAACMMVRADVYRSVNGLSEDYPVAFNDVDFCLRLRSAGKLIVWTPFAEAYHHESKTRGKDTDPARRARFGEDCKQFRAQWGEVLKKGDPYYNINFTLDRADFSFDW